MNFVDYTKCIAVMGIAGVLSFFPVQAQTKETPWFLFAREGMQVDEKKPIQFKVLEDTTLSGNTDYKEIDTIQSCSLIMGQTIEVNSENTVSVTLQYGEYRYNAEHEFEMTFKEENGPSIHRAQFQKGLVLKEVSELDNGLCLMEFNGERMIENCFSRDPDKNRNFFQVSKRIQQDITRVSCADGNSVWLMVNQFENARFEKTPNH